MAPNRSNLTERDLAILDALALRVRVFSVAQVGDSFFSATEQPVANARRRLSVLAARGHVELFAMAARPIPKPIRRILRWQPGLTPPDFAELSYRLTSRWAGQARMTPLVTATRETGAWLGGYGGRRPRQSEVSHDISLAAVYLNWIARHPGRQDAWTSEASLKKRGFGDHAMLPDALVEFGGRRTVIEYGGAYSARKLAGFHRFCEERGLPYELW